jgi:hypothetical protein
MFQIILLKGVQSMSRGQKSSNTSQPYEGAEESQIEDTTKEAFYYLEKRKNFSHIKNFFLLFISVSFLLRKRLLKYFPKKNKFYQYLMSKKNKYFSAKKTH